jgi:hypothetical protein
LEGGDRDHLCPHCGAPSEPNQEYCLECGRRLGDPATLVGRLGGAWRERFGWYPGDWIWPVLIGLLVAVAGSVAAVAVASGNSGGKPLVATHPGVPREPVTPPATATVALPTVPRGTPTTSGPPPTPSTPPPARSTAPTAGGLTTWPANRAGYTVVVESIPASAGRPLAVARARSALRAGLPNVGVLDSGRYSSLHPGYWVVFSGIYATAGEAASAQQNAATKGFTAAYSRQITR